MHEIGYRDAVRLAEHYLAIGETELYLRDGEMPWEYVTAIEPGGGHRLEIATSIRFYAATPCGLSFCWHLDLEPDSANGKGSYEIDTGAVRETLTLLRPSMRAEFRAILRQDADAVAAKAAEWRATTERQEVVARILYELAAAEVTA